MLPTRNARRSAFLTRPRQMETQGLAVNARMALMGIVERQKGGADCRKLGVGDGEAVDPVGVFGQERGVVDGGLEEALGCRAGPASGGEGLEFRGERGRAGLETAAALARLEGRARAAAAKALSSWVGGAGALLKRPPWPGWGGVQAGRCDRTSAL